jgi:hypothetical protein
VVVLIVLGALLAVGIVGYCVHKHYFSSASSTDYNKMGNNPEHPSRARPLSAAASPAPTNEPTVSPTPIPSLAPSAVPSAA